MIDTKELMLGNWVECKCRMDGNETSLPIKIELVAKHSVDVILGGEAWNYDDYELIGIPITEELLEKCGFEKEELPSYMDKEYTKDGVQVNLKGGEVYLSSFKGELSEIRYLHELQNAYFMITREQLEVDFQ